MNLFLFLLVCIGFVYLNSRISSLERLFRSNYSPRSPQPEKESAAVQPAPVASVATAPHVRTDNSDQASHISGEQISGQWLGRIGVFAVFAGIASFLQYAFSHDLIGPAGRIATGVVIAVLFSVLGIQIAQKYRWYASLMSGAGIAIMYVTVACTHALYHFVSAPVALFLMLLVTAASVLMSLHISVRTLATVGIVGGFLTPLFVNFSASPSDLLVYYAVFNIGILAVSFVRRWPALTTVAFVGTALSVLQWLLKYYNESTYLWTIVIFVTIYFLIFLAATLTHHIVRQEQSSSADVGLTMLNGLGYFGLCWALLDPLYHSSMGYFALAMAALYFAVGYLCHFYNARNTALNVLLPAIGVVFTSIAIPFYFSGDWITVAWLLEAALLYLISFKIHNLNLHWYGAVVFVIGAMRALFSTAYSEHAFMNAPFAIALVSVVAAYGIAYMHSLYADHSQASGKGKLAPALYVVYANCATVFAVTNELLIYFSNTDQFSVAVIVFWAVYAIGLMAIGITYRIPNLRKLSLVLFAFTAIRVFVTLWGLGEVYRIVAFIVFGGIALIASFAYAKYKDRITSI